jgi:hypothetical protein
MLFPSDFVGKSGIGGIDARIRRVDIIAVTEKVGVRISGIKRNNGVAYGRIRLGNVGRHRGFNLPQYDLRNVAIHRARLSSWLKSLRSFRNCGKGGERTGWKRQSALWSFGFAHIDPD